VNEAGWCRQDISIGLLPMEFENNYFRNQAGG
jgi:hypothetical protein